MDGSRDDGKAAVANERPSHASSSSDRTSADGPGMAHARAGFAKPSMWQAPQSLLYPTAPPLPQREVSDRLREKYFRRVAMPHRYEGPPPAMWQRKAQLAGGVLSGIVGVYLVFLHDFGPQEHCFTWIREVVGSEKLNPFALSPEEQAWARQQREKTKMERIAKERDWKKTQEERLLQPEQTSQQRLPTSLSSTGGGQGRLV